MPTWGDLEWHEHIVRRIRAARRRPLRIVDLGVAVMVVAVVLGLVRFIAGVVDGPLDPTSVWLALLACVGVAAIVGVVSALTLGRVASALYARAIGRRGRVASALVAASRAADLAAVGLLMTIALGLTLFLVLSALILLMSRE